MSDYTKSAWFTVRRWMIAEMVEAGLVNPAHYVDSSPVVPIQQIPEVTDARSLAEAGMPTDAPFIVYDVVIPGGYDTEYWNCRDEVSLWIYDYDLEKVFAIKEFLYDLFRRFDEAASDINDFDDPGSPFTFHYFDVLMGLPTDEMDQVLGRFGMNIVIAYQYTRPITTRGRFA